MAENTHQLDGAPVVYDDPKDDRQTAFEVWLLLADRSPGKTVKILEQDYGIEAKPQTISTWAKRHGWHEKTRETLSGMYPTLMERAAASITAGAPDAAHYLHEVARGSAEPDRNRIVASVAVLDRAGFMPHTRKEAERLGSPVSHASTAVDDDPLSGISDAELRAIVASRAT